MRTFHIVNVCIFVTIVTIEYTSIALTPYFVTTKIRLLLFPIRAPYDNNSASSIACADEDVNRA